jgi:exopolysaccharide biosynthesis predicted pyruvyltransferase EpsI
MYQNKDGEIQTSREKLLKTFRNSSDLVFIRAWGNIGDELIYAGMRQLLSGFNYREVSIQNLQNISGHTAIVAGSGGWCKPFHSMPSFLPIIEDCFQSVIVFPSSFDPAEEIVRISLEQTNALIFARELVSYQKIRGLCKSDIAHDCAFYFNYDQYKKNGNGILNAFRGDEESLNKPLPEGNIDISVTCSSLDEWLWTISQYDVVRTDRAHVMIAGAMLGKQVEYNTSNYHKVPAIAEFALKPYSVTRISDLPFPNHRVSTFEDNLFISQRELRNIYTKEKIFKFANFLATRSSCTSIVIINDIESFNLDLDCLKDAIVIIPNAFSSIEHLPRVSILLRMMEQTVLKIILFENIDPPDVKKAEILLKRKDLPIELVGFVKEQNQKVDTVAIISPGGISNYQSTPDDFRVIAVISSYNEEDIIIPVINQLIQDGIEVYLIDNWSNDETYHRAKSLLGKGLIGIEKFPNNGFSPTYDHNEILKRKEILCQELGADWYIHHDADEYRESPWEGICLRDAIYRVDQEGYNSINFTVLNFFPVNNNYPPGTSFIDFFKYFEFGKHAAYSIQTQAWKKTSDRVNLHESGGHDVDFPLRKIFPYNFLLRHYPIRSQSHGERKVFRERKQRYNPIEKKNGWHNHYDIYDVGSNFIKSSKDLIEFRSSFYTEYLTERLSGLGIVSPETEDFLVDQHKEEHVIGNTEIIELEAESEREARLIKAQLADIKKSKAWKLALLFRKIRIMVVPPNSKRAKGIRYLFKLIVYPIKNLRKYFFDEKY